MAKFTEKQCALLKKRKFWCVSSSHQATRMAIQTLLLEEQMSTEEVRVFIDGEEEIVFPINSAIAITLSEGRKTDDYEFMAYSKQNDQVPWSFWKEGKEGPSAKTRSNFQWSNNRGRSLAS